MWPTTCQKYETNNEHNKHVIMSSSFTVVELHNNATKETPIEVTIPTPIVIMKKNGDTNTPPTTLASQHANAIAGI